MMSASKSYEHDYVNVEGMIKAFPIYVLDALNKWFDVILPTERERPSISDLSNGISRTITPMQMYEEMKMPLVMKLSEEERSQAVEKMSDTKKELLGQIILKQLTKWDGGKKTVEPAIEQDDSPDYFI
jgi:hypothetical protein